MFETPITLFIAGTLWVLVQSPMGLLLLHPSTLTHVLYYCLQLLVSHEVTRSLQEARYQSSVYTLISPTVIAYMEQGSLRVRMNMGSTPCLMGLLQSKNNRYSCYKALMGRTGPSLTPNFHQLSSSH